VLQGERPMAADNKTLGRFILDGIPPAPRGVPQIEVSFDIDADGILNVAAKDRATGREQKITITASSGLSREEVDRMVREAEGHRAEDQRRREEIEARNQADSMRYVAEKTLRDQGDKVPENVRSDVNAKIEALNNAMNSNDVARMKQATQDLNIALQAIGQAMYETYQGAGEPGAGTPPPGADGGMGADGGPGPEDEGTVEGEYREV
jgi:molecular chaperone DnaK